MKTTQHPHRIINIRVASTRRDFDQARVLVDQYFSWALAESGFDNLADVDPVTAAEVDHLAEHYADPSARLLLAIAPDGTAVGMCALEQRDASSAELKRLYVRPERRRRGIATQLVTAATELAEDAGYSIMRLDTHAGIMAPAIALYRRLGFEETTHRCTSIDIDGMTGFERRLSPRAREHHTGPVTTSRRVISFGWFALVALFVALVLPGTSASAAQPMPASPSSSTAPAFGRGLWRGVAVVTGSLYATDTTASIGTPMQFNFEVRVDADGLVAEGEWTVSGDVSANSGAGGGVFSVTGSGSLAGTAERVEAAGTTTFSGSVTVEGQTTPMTFDVPGAAAFSPTSASCGIVTGDIAVEAREIQAASGFGTTVTGPFTAYLVDEATPGADDQDVAGYVDVVTRVEELLVAADPPPADEVVALIDRAQLYYVGIPIPAACPEQTGEAPPTLTDRYLLGRLGALVVRTMSVPDASTVDGLRAVADAANRVGIFGDAAMDLALADEVIRSVHDAFAAKLAASTSPSECASIAIAAGELGFTDLASAAGSSCPA